MQPRRSGLRYLLLCGLAAVLGAGGTSAAPNKARSTPARLSAQQIVAKNVAARGGLEAWRKVQTMIWMGHIESAHAVVPSMLFMLSQQRPNKMRFEINAMGEKTLRVFDGTQGWKLRPAHGRPDVQPYTTDEVRFAQSGPGLDGPLIDYAEKGSSVSVIGIDNIEKHDAYHLIVRTAASDSQHVWVDAKTFLETRYDRPAAGPAGASRTVSVMYRDYKTTDGLTIPSTIETGVGPGAPPDRMVIERVILNPPLNEQTFRVPGQRSVREPVPSRHRRPLPDGVLPSPRSSPAAPAQSGAVPPANPLAPPADPTPAPVSPPSASGEDPGSASP
jgi:outer membrane lipoprotein-sorting protein